MNNSIYKATLDIHSIHSQTSFYVVKNDSARKFVFTLADGTKPYEIAPDCTAVFRAKKPDGTILYNTCEIMDNKIVYILTNQTSSSVGALDCEVTLYGGDKRQITSPRFLMVNY